MYIYTRIVGSAVLLLFAVPWIAHGFYPLLLISVLMSCFSAQGVIDAHILHICSKLVRVSLSAADGIPSGADGEFVRSLQHVTSLDLSRCNKIMDAGLAHLGQLSQLTNLNLESCKQITDAGLAHLGQLSQLTNLRLGNCNQITDAGLACLGQLSQLANLFLSCCNQITDAGLAHLGQLSQLTNLNLPYSEQITDAGRNLVPCLRRR